MKVFVAARIALLVVVAMLVAACGTEADPVAEAEGPTADDPAQEEAPAEDGDYTVPAEYQRLVLVGASQGGSGYSWMAAAAEVLNRHLDGAEFSVQAGGPTENALLLEDASIEAGMTSVADLFEATQDPGALESTDIRTLWGMFNGSWQIIAAPNSGVESFEDIVGHRIAAGIVGGGELELFLEAAECAGLSEDEFTLQAIGKAEASSAYQDGNIDVWAGLSPAPAPVFAEVIEGRRGGSLIGLEPDVVECLEQSGKYVAGTIPAGSYEGQDEEIQTVDQWYSLAGLAELPDDLVYHIARVLHEHHDEFVASFRGAAKSTIETTAAIRGFELHPGTQRYLAEQGHG